MYNNCQPRIVGYLSNLIQHKEMSYLRPVDSLTARVVLSVLCVVLNIDVTNYAWLTTICI